MHNYMCYAFYTIDSVNRFVYASITTSVGNSLHYVTMATTLGWPQSYGTPSFMQSIVDCSIIMWCMTAFWK